MADKKQIIQITERAKDQIRFLLEKREKPALGIRVGIKQGGCSGLKYTFEYADQHKPMEEVVEVDGLKVFIDPLAVMYILGTTLDYYESKLESGFKFDNPNAKASCGCGESFTV